MQIVKVIWSECVSVYLKPGMDDYITCCALRTSRYSFANSETIFLFLKWKYKRSGSSLQLN